MITIEDCLRAASPERAALFIASKVAFDRSKGYVRSLDGKTFWEFARKLDHRVASIQRQLYRKSYEFGPCKQIIRTRSGKERKIYISNWSDRIVERWLSTALSELLSKYFSQSAYAYRRQSLGIDVCQDRVAEAMLSNKFFIQRDITKYFYSIDHEILLDKLSKLVDPTLLTLLAQRVRFSYGAGDGVECVADLGVAFGTPIACVLSNIYLTDLDYEMMALPVYYFRYADDFLVASKLAEDALMAASTLDAGLAKLKLKTKASHTNNISFGDEAGFTKVTKFKYLGLEFKPDGSIKLPVEKQRKIINFFKRGIAAEIPRIRQADDKLAAVIAAANLVVEKRIRSVAIIDYYLKHVTDEHQLCNMDRLIAELVISTVTGKPFRKSDFRKISFNRLRELGLVSLVHRCRLHHHDKIHVPFLTMFNSMMLERHESAIDRNRVRLQRIKMSRKLKSQDGH